MNFLSFTCQRYHTFYKSFEDIDMKLKIDWYRIIKEHDLNCDSTGFIAEANGELLKENLSLIDCVRNVLSVERLLPIIPYAFVLTTPSGEVIDIISEAVPSNDCKLKIGTNLSLEYGGINAISVSIKLGETAVICGSEHTFSFFSKCNCICSPLRACNEIVGYIALVLSSESDFLFALPYLENLSKWFEHKLVCSDSNLRMKYLMGLLSKYFLTEREKEVGLLWLENQSVEQISKNLFIAKGTVQQIIKKIYIKTDVDSHGKFICKFLSEFY